MPLSLLRPQSAGSAILSGGGIGTTGSTILMKVVSSRFMLSVGVAETTGDGDEFTQIEHANEFRGQIMMNGFVLSSGDIGLNNLVNKAVGSETQPMVVKFKVADAQFYNFDMVVKDVIIDWNRQAPVIGISIVGLLTGEHGSTNLAFKETST